MLKTKYILLSLSLIELAIGFSNARPTIFFYLGLPVGTILFCLFLIFQFLGKESALYDEQNRAAELERQASMPTKSQSQSTRAEAAATNPIFGAAHSH
jgi:hypothetical protein